MDNVNHPEHYQGNGIECIDAMLACAGEKSVKDFCRLNALKYIWRAEQKCNPTEDMKKARWYIDKYIEIATNER